MRPALPLELCHHTPFSSSSHGAYISAVQYRRHTTYRDIKILYRDMIYENHVFLCRDILKIVA